MTGKMVKDLKTNETYLEVDVSSLANGLYLLKIHTEKGLLEKKIVKQ